MPTRFRKENARPNQDLKQERQLNGCRKFGRNIQQADAKREIAVVALGAPLVGGLPLKDY